MGKIPRWNRNGGIRLLSMKITSYKLGYASLFHLQLIIFAPIQKNQNAI